uniref:F-box protein n=1 Tax=Cucumis melo TaxID=3656 RepID=A0A9I9E866_CUCME
MITSFTDLAQACGVCRKWKEGVKLSLGRRNSLSFAGWKMDDNSTARLIRHAYSLWELDIFSGELRLSNCLDTLGGSGSRRHACGI